MSAPTLADIYLSSQVSVTYDDPALETFYEQLLRLMGEGENLTWTKTFCITLHFKEPDLILVRVNRNIFARLSTNPRYADVECLVKNLSK